MRQRISICNVIIKFVKQYQISLELFLQQKREAKGDNVGFAILLANIDSIKSVAITISQRV
jgi:hypothetical protein